MTREEIYGALFGLFSGMTEFKVKSRRVRLWTDVAPVEQPALFMAQLPEDVVRQTGQPKTKRLHVELYLYAHTQNARENPASVLNALVDAVEAKLEPAQGEIQTLGGRVQYCRISGAIETDEGRLGDQAVAIIPIEILTT